MREPTLLSFPEVTKMRIRVTRLYTQVTVAETRTPVSRLQTNSSPGETRHWHEAESLVCQSVSFAVPTSIRHTRPKLAIGMTVFTPWRSTGKRLASHVSRFGDTA